MAGKQKIWFDAHDKRFIPEDDFARITELLEDRGLSRILKAAKKTDTPKPGIPFAEVKKQLAARRGK